TRGLVVGHVAPEAWVGGPIALLKDGDTVTIDVDRKRLDAMIDDAELARRRAAWKKPEPREKRGVLAKYARTVRSASEGAVTF
ncbi:MAG TPA: dihydroxy-acid dehydratase, partial [Terriglobia bacterium]|nr:dihydroxy-acid dehydratase [Terriglobia bacterium]